MAHARSSRTGADDTSLSRDADRLQFDTDELPEKDRIAVFREAFGRQMLRLDMEPLPADRFHADAMVASLPGLDVVWALNSPLCARRTPQLLPDGNESFMFQCADSDWFCMDLGRVVALVALDVII